MNTGVVFGVFDGLHDGHRAMLEQARFRVDRLIAVVPNDAVVERLKGHPPSRSWNQRAEELRASGLVDEVVQGDDDEGEYHVLDTVKPDVILLGYDQKGLRKDLERHYALRTTHYALVTLDPHHPDRYKSSLLNPV